MAYHLSRQASVMHGIDEGSHMQCGVDENVRLGMWEMMETPPPFVCLFPATENGHTSSTTGFWNDKGIIPHIQFHCLSIQAIRSVSKPPPNQQERNRESRIEL